MAKRVDANQKEIVDALRKVGATVQHLHKLGEGCPDIAVGFRSHNYLIEIKMPKGQLNDDQEKWHQHWNGQVAVVRSPEDALKVIGAITFETLNTSVTYAEYKPDTEAGC